MSAQPAGLTLTLRWALDAPRNRVFRALTEPTELARWWGPHGFTTLVTKLDLRVGGGYRFSMQPPDGDSFQLSGEFLEIDPPRHLAYTFRWEEPTPDDRDTDVALSLDTVANSTAVSLVQGTFATEERLALHRAGWTDSFERLRTASWPGP
ncbi:MAG: SRPBCC family protein [Actinomycetes bacterium]